MYAQKIETLPPPPGVIGSIRAGFEAVSSHVILILLPLLLDLLLWLGPRLSVSDILGPVYQLFFDQVRRGLSAQDEINQLVTFQDLLREGLQQYNLVSLVSRLQTFPIGIPSLLAKTMPVDTPLGAQNAVQVASPLGMSGYVFLFVPIGWVLGALYYRWVSGAILRGRDGYIGIPYAIFQTLLLSALWLVFLFMISIPVTMFLAFLTLLSPALASIALFVMVLAMFWLVVPFFFIPHGIFVRRQNAFRSIVSSFRMVRYSFPSSALFVFCIFILTTGLNYLWSVPPGDSWMTLIGIAGHAFITTALLAASFVYYRDMSGWLHIVIEKLKPKMPPLPGGSR
jgi:hypothetical protein